MAVPSDQDWELLEAYLDDELSSGETEELRRRIDADPQLGESLRTLVAERSSRDGWYAWLEASGTDVEQLVCGAVARAKQRVRARRMWSGARYAAAAAACLAIGYYIGSVSKPRTTGSPVSLSTAPAGPAEVYQVAITDDSGAVVAVQKFRSLDEARAFSADLQRWQEKQETLLTGQATVRATEF